MKAIKAARLKKALRQRGLGKYRTKIIKRLKPWKMDHYLYLLSIKPGDIINDCDGFNHRVVGIASIDCWPSWKGGSPALTIQFEREDGFWSCGCPSGPDRPWSNKRILEFQKGYYLDDERREKAIKDGWWNQRSEKIRQALLAGEPIVDNDGIPLFPREKEA
jgi:hypothetical protein